MATVTKTTVEVSVGQYRYRAELDGNAVELYRDGVLAGDARWNGAEIEGFPLALSDDARDALTAAIVHNLEKAWRGRTEGLAHDDGIVRQEPPRASPVLPSAAKTRDASNHGQMGDETGRPSRQGEAEVGEGGPGCDPNTGEIGGQAIKPHRRAIGDGFRKPS
ncbi:MAG TPA: hypothetical protein VGM56_14340 [Byssovorax sp.]|jgi:hypothetical protein